MSVNSFLGDTVLRTVIKLIVISVLVGMAMNVFGIYPVDIFWAVRDFFVNLWERGFEAFGRFGQWFLLGAMVVVPVFLILRVLSYRGRA